jgi:hypothetical protein
MEKRGHQKKKKGDIPEKGDIPDFQSWKSGMSPFSLFQECPLFFRSTAPARISACVCAVGW